MKCARQMVWVACAMLLVAVGIRMAWADSYSIGVYAGVSSPPTPADVATGVNSSATLWSASDSPQVQSEAYMVASSINWNIVSVQYSVDGVNYSTSVPAANIALTSPLTGSTGANFYAGSAGYWKVSCQASYWYQDNLGNEWSGMSNGVDVVFHVW